jgi:hypothetical protein
MPTVAGAPKELNDLLEKVYTEAYTKGKASKAAASQIAWKAAKDAGWKKVGDKWEKKKAEMSEEITVDAFKEGSYPQGEFTGKELSEIADTYDPEKYEAPVLIGHISDPAYKGKTTIPAFGWIGKVKQVGTHLKFVFSQFSEELKNLIDGGYYKKVSAAFFDPSDPNNPTPGKWHLHHLAFLGAVPPAVKGLEGIAFAEILGMGVEFAEVDTQMETVDVDKIEELGAQKTIKDLEESCATFVSKISESLTNEVDKEIQTTRCQLAASDLANEIASTLQEYWGLQDTLEDIEELQENEYSEKQSGAFKKIIAMFSQKLTHNQSKESDMDKEQEAKLQKEIADLKKQNLEFSEAKTKAETEKATAEKTANETADKQLKAEIHSFCEENKLNTNKYKDMKIEDQLFAAAKAGSSIEFASKDKDGKDVVTKRPLLEVLKETLKAFQIATPKEGEMTEFNDKLPGEKKTGKVELAEQYVNAHPEQFADAETMQQKKAKALKMESNKQIQFK